MDLAEVLTNEARDIRPRPRLSRVIAAELAALHVRTHQERAHHHVGGGGEGRASHCSGEGQRRHLWLPSEAVEHRLEVGCGK